MIVSDTKSKILSFAIELFARNGYEKTSMRNIAEKVGIKPASIYYFYGSKESLLEAVFSEFKSNFSKYRNSPETILKAAEYKPLPEVLSMLFYAFGSPAENKRMMLITRVMLSLQYENPLAQELIQEVMIQTSVEYGVAVMEKLHSAGKIKEADYKWISFFMLSFAMGLLRESIRHNKPYKSKSEKYIEGIACVCSMVSDKLKV